MVNSAGGESNEKQRSCGVVDQALDGVGVFSEVSERVFTPDAVFPGGRHSLTRLSPSMQLMVAVVEGAFLDLDRVMDKPRRALVIGRGQSRDRRAGLVEFGIAPWFSGLPGWARAGSENVWSLEVICGVVVGLNEEMLREELMRRYRVVRKAVLEEQWKLERRGQERGAVVCKIGEQAGAE